MTSTFGRIVCSIWMVAQGVVIAAATNDDRQGPENQLVGSDVGAFVPRSGLALPGIPRRRGDIQSYDTIEKFAAIGPSAGWISFDSYARTSSDDEPPPTSLSQLLDRGRVIADPISLAGNLKQVGVYILHGGADDNVPPEQSQRMAEVLKESHHDWVYHEEPGQGHWWGTDVKDASGAPCMDWPHMYDLFARHALPSSRALRTVEFATANPGVSGRCHWLGIEAQQRQHAVSRAHITTWPNERRFRGTTENVAILRLARTPLLSTGRITVELDGQTIEDIDAASETTDVWLRRDTDGWQVCQPPPASHKNARRYGSIKNELRHRFLFVYGTAGNDEENRWTLAKAGFDAETFWYRGNGSVDLMADVDFSPQDEPDRTVVLYGNADTNVAWSKLLKKSPAKVHRDRLIVGKRALEGNHFAVLFLQPRAGSDVASVIVVAATGPIGMRLACKQSLFVPFVRYPDCVIWSADGLKQGRATIRGAGYFGLDWSVENGEFIWENG